VYLAGTINLADAYFQRWRLEATETLLRHSITPLSPLAQKETAIFSKDGGVTSNIPSPDIFMRDYKMVQSSNLILANLKIVGDSGKPIEKPLIGTYFEMAWAWHDKKPIIAVVEPDNYLFNNHPFLAATITHKFPTLEEALHNIVSYWNWHWSDPSD
jgi:nucleoside 2-deoxyribosyltransferase